MILWGHPGTYPSMTLWGYPGTYPNMTLWGYPGTYPSMTLWGYPGTYPSTYDPLGVPGYTPEYDQNNQVCYPSTLEHIWPTNHALGKITGINRGTLSCKCCVWFFFGVFFLALRGEKTAAYSSINAIYLPRRKRTKRYAA